MALSAEVKVGFFVFVVIIMLGVLVLGIADINIHKKGYNVDILFPSAAGLEENAQVSLAGMKIGKVERIILESDVEGNPRVRVRLRINEGVMIPDGSKPIITVSSLLGERYIEIMPSKSSGKFVASGGEMTGLPPSDFSTFLSETGGMMGDLKDTLGKIKGFLSDENRENITKTLSNTNNITGDIKDVVRDAKPGIKGTISNLHSITTTINNVITPNEERLRNTVVDLSDTVKSLKKVSADLEVTMANVRQISDKINKGEGTIGKLVYDPSLYDNLNNTIQNANKLITDFQERPTRYLNLSIF
jgi:phospholipid/cholesterol/gamma-HCH transport system substrate-binding protein